MTVQISIQATLNNSANFFVVAWYSASAPSVLINKVVPTKPYGNPFQVPLTGLIAGQTYVVKLWESPDNTATGTVRNSMSLTPTQSNTTTRFPDYLTADITPGLVNNTTTYVNLTYAGWGYDVERVGQGTMFPVGSDAIEPDYDQDSTGGFHLVKTGDVFEENEKFVVRFIPQVAPAAPSNTNVITSGTVITAATVMDNTYLNQALLLQGSGSSLPLTLPPLSSVQDFQFAYIYSAGGNHVSAPITVGAPGDRIQRRTLVTQVILCQNEFVKLFKFNGAWQVDAISPTVDMVGEIIYKMIRTEFNYLFLDGSLVSRTVYARLYAWFNSLANSISEINWAQVNSYDGRSYQLNNGFWTQGDGSTTFRLPKLTGKFIRSVDGSTRLAASGEVDAQIQHSHNTLPGLFPGSPFGKGPVFANAARYGGQATNATDLTDKMWNTPGAGNVGAVLQRQDVEVRPVNTGEYAIIRL